MVSSPATCREGVFSGFLQFRRKCSTTLSWDRFKSKFASDAHERQLVIYVGRRLEVSSGKRGCWGSYDGIHMQITPSTSSF